MGKPKITLYLDIVSPFSYIGYYTLRHHPSFSQCDVEYVPIFLGGLFKLCDNRAPLLIKNKDKWMTDERSRWSTFFNVPMKDAAPPGFPMNTIQIQRVLAAIELKSPDKLLPAIDATYEAVWQRHDDIRDAATIKSVLTSAVGQQSAEVVIEEAQKTEAKKQLSDNTEKAFQSNAFGLPWFQCTNAKGETHGFWGVDHMGQMMDFLDLERPSQKEWRALL